MSEPSTNLVSRVSRLTQYLADFESFTEFYTPKIQERVNPVLSASRRRKYHLRTLTSQETISVTTIAILLLSQNKKPRVVITCDQANFSALSPTSFPGSLIFPPPENEVALSLTYSSSLRGRAKITIFRATSVKRIRNAKNSPDRRLRCNESLMMVFVIINCEQSIFPPQILGN